MKRRQTLQGIGKKKERAVDFKIPINQIKCMLTAFQNFKLQCYANYKTLLGV